MHDYHIICKLGMHVRILKYVAIPFTNAMISSKLGCMSRQSYWQYIHADIIRAVIKAVI